MNKRTCPCCGNVLLRHMRNSGLYWVCTDCWQEMPVIQEEEAETNLEDVTALEEAFRAPAQLREDSAEGSLQSL
ncbi:MAG: hypothetical protein F6K04_21350 [Leptolyngbya sp. SIO4C5]|uniref:hypothetical protein n=1 Tax=Sphaerothrix gracilis TaxID=3151835 RepID=UPI0013C0D047|nr:hypothetical protein [Leptolyngbya sp. SIO4C5]